MAGQDSGDDLSALFAAARDRHAAVLGTPPPGHLPMEPPSPDPGLLTAHGEVMLWTPGQGQGAPPALPARPGAPAIGATIGGDSPVHTAHLPVVKPAQRGGFNAAYGRNRMAGVGVVGELPAPLRVQAQDRTPLIIDVVAQPSLKVFQEAGTRDTVSALRRRTRFMEHIGSEDLYELELLLTQVRETMENMSRGPLSLRMLRAMSHPYGYDRVQGEQGVVLHPRKVQRHQGSVFGGGTSIGHVAGIRGSVPTYSVINQQSETLANSYRSQIVVKHDGIVLEVRNTAKSDRGAPYPWFLARGTEHMRPHGPWTYAFLRLMHDIDAAWVRVATRAHYRSRASAMALVLGDNAAE